MINPEKPQIGLPFQLYDYDTGYSKAAKEVSKLIGNGSLPNDTFFRLAGVGQKTDSSYKGGSYLLNYTMMLEIAEHATSSPELIREQTKAVLYGDLPGAIVDVNSRFNYASYSMVDTTYYTLYDLADTIKARREEYGQTLPERDFDKRLHTPNQNEDSRCIGMARKIWGVIVNRHYPEWFEVPSDHYPSARIGAFAVVYSIGDKQMKRGIVTNAVISDPVVSNFYNEVVETGVKRIGSVGREDLRRLLLEEHPKLLEGHELPLGAKLLPES
jgi:hypothetical protein